MEQAFWAENRMAAYLQEHSVLFTVDTCGGIRRLNVLYKGCQQSPGQVLEGCFCFHPRHMEARVFYTFGAGDFGGTSSHLADLLGLLNYVNSTVWLRTCDGASGRLYAGGLLYTPRLYMTENACRDIVLTTMVPYDFYELAPVETEDFLTAGWPEFLNAISPAIFALLMGKIPPDAARTLVDGAVF